MTRRNQSPEHATAVPPQPALWADRLLVALLRHWLAWLLAALLVFAGLPFLAPVAMAAGLDKLGDLIYMLYAPFCHQLPQRSWFFFGEKLTYSLDEIAQVYPFADAARLRAFVGTAEMGWKVAWSDRMVSFYAMIPVFGLVYAALRSVRRAPRPLAWQWLVAALLPLALDGATHVINDLLVGVAGGGFRDLNGWLARLTDYAYPGFYAGDHLGTFNWWMRLLTGLLAAWGVAFTLLPWLDRVADDR